MNEKLLIIGAGGHGKVIADIALKMNKWRNIAFLDDNENVGSVMGLEVLGTSNTLINYIDHYQIFIGIGDNMTRQKIHMMLEAAGANIPTLIHPNSTIGNEVYIGNGTAIMAGTVINCCTKIGKGCIINTGSKIDHDNHIEDFVHISPGAQLAGTVKVGKGTWLGIGSVVINNVNITANCKIGAAGLVLRDITEHGTYVGIPVRRI